jgi:hypothetical protein
MDWHHVPAALECPCDGAEYDCGKRAPLRSPCRCKRLMCRKCAAVVSSLPHAAPCGLCGAKAVGPFELPHFARDVGVDAVLLAQDAAVASACAECLDAGHDTPGDYTCMDVACDLKTLCDAHSLLHKRWGHGVVAASAAAAVAPAMHLDISHCPNPEHAGAEGLLTLYCKPCSAMVCRLCADGHLDQGHAVTTVVKAAAGATDQLRAALPVLEAGIQRFTRFYGELHDVKAVLDTNRVAALEHLAADAARLHQQVDAAHAAAVCEVDKLFDAKVYGLAVRTTASRGVLAELTTMAKVAHVALAEAASPVVAVHAASSVAATLPRLAALEPPVLQVKQHLFLHGNGVDLPRACFASVGDGDVLQVPPVDLPHQPKAWMTREDFFLDALEGLWAHVKPGPGEATDAPCVQQRAKTCLFAMDYVSFILTLPWGEGGTGRIITKLCVDILLTLSSASAALPHSIYNLARAAPVVLQTLRARCRDRAIAESCVGFWQKMCAHPELLAVLAVLCELPVRPVLDLFLSLEGSSGKVRDMALFVLEKVG